MKKSICCRCVLLALCLAANLLRADVVTHNVGDVSSLTVDKVWEVQLVDPMFRGDRFMYSAFFKDPESESKTGSQSAVFYTVLDPPRDVLVTVKPEEIARASTAPMVSKIVRKAKETEVGELKIYHRKGDVKNRWHYKQVLSNKESGEILILFGMVWKTDLRTHCLHSFSTDLVDQYGFWDDFFKKWKRLDTLNQVHADSYRARNKFLTKEQKKKLKETTKSEWVSDIELRGMAEALEKKEDPVKRKKYENMRLHAAARKMRLIYYKLLTEKQKKDFDQSVKKRLEEKRK